MNLISLEEYSKINEAVIGLRNMISVEEFKQLKENERKNIIKLLLLNSSDGTGLFENKDAVNHILIESGLLEKSDNIFESLNESLDEGWDDDVSTGIAATGAAAGAAALSLAAYISFLFKKKKIRKAWDAVKDIQKTKIEKDVIAYEDKMDLNAKVSKEKFEQFKADKEKEIENLEQEKAQKTGPNAADELKSEINALKVELAKLDPIAHPAPEKEETETVEDDPKKEKPKEEKPKTEESLKEADEDPKEEKPKEDKHKEDKPKEDKPKEDKPKEDKPKEDKPKEDKPKEDKPKSDDGGPEEKGQKQLAKDKLDQAIEAEEENLEKEKKKISDKKAQNSEKRQKIKDGAGSTEQKNKKVEKISKEDKTLSDKIKGLEEDGSKVKQKAQSQYDSIKQDILNKEETLAELKADKANILDPAQKAKVAKDYDDKIKDLKADIVEREKETRPDTEANVKKETISKGLERDIEQLNKDQSAAEEDAQRISGVDASGKATGIGGKVLGFSASYVAQIKAANKQELLNDEKDALLQKASIDQQQIDSMSKDAGKKKEKAASNLDQEIADAAEKEKGSEKALKSEVKSVDASDDDIAKADKEVKKKQEEEESRQAEEKKDQTNDKKDAISKQIEKHEKKIESLKKEVADKGGKPKEAAQYKLDQTKKKLEGAKEQYSKLGESFGLKLQLAMIGEEINSIMSEYDLIIEGTRKELIPEEEKKDEDAKDDVEKDKKKIDNLKGSKDKEKDSEDDDGDGIKDPADVAKDIEKESEKEDESNPLIGKKVVLKNMRDKDLGQLEKATGKIIKSFAEGEREPEGDLPRRAGEPEVYKIKFDKPKDPMYSEINLTKDHFEEAPEKKKEEKTEESVANKFRSALNEASRLPQLEELKKLQQKVYDSSESGAIDLWEAYAKRVIGIDGEWSKAPEGSWPKAIKELENICTKYSIK